MVNLQAQLAAVTHDIQVDLSSGFIYAFSPIAKVELNENNNFLITITDRDGTTTAEIPNFTDEKINEAIRIYLQSHPIIQQHDESHQAHAYIRGLIDEAIKKIPTKVSQLQNDKQYISNFKQLLVPYNSFLEFPNIPPETERDKVFLDKSTGDMYVFAVDGKFVYTPFGIANNDIIYGGDSTQN